jgi:septal ring factor EnvC (AmiA/AmiB activator)
LINLFSQKFLLIKLWKGFQKQKSKVITISDLQHEINNIKKEIIDLKGDLHTVKTDNKDLKQQILLLNLQNHFNANNSDNE